MKKTSLLPILLTLTLVSCTQESKKTTSSSSDPYSCAQYPYQPQCVGSTTGTTTGGTTGGTTGTTTGGTTTGTTTGGTTGGHSYTTIPSDNNWQALYPNGVPAESCTSPTGTGYDLRKGTITVAGGTWYSPANAWTTVGDAEYRSISYTHNNSHFLVNVNDAKAFLDTDAKLKVRFMVRPQPKPPVGKTWCYNRATGQSADTYGYTVLKFNVSLRGVNPDGSLKPSLLSTRSVTVPVNSCSSALDFSGLNQSNPDGLVLVVHDVQSDQGCWYSKNCTSFVAVRQASCWQMDVHVSVDGTKDI